jgi:predicted transcriptional regulator
MASRTVRVSSKTHHLLKELSELTGQSMPAVLDKAIEAYRRRQFLDGLAADFARLRQNPKAWRQELEERAEWDAMLADGLKDDQ